MTLLILKNLSFESMMTKSCCRRAGAMSPVVAITIYIQIILLSLYFPSCLSSTHWIVTEDGRVQAQVDSIFQLRRPYDLVALMQQEDRSSVVEKLKQELMAHKQDIDEKEDKEMNLEHRLYATDPSCVAAGKPLTEFDLYITTVLLFESRGISVEDIVKGTTSSLTGRRNRPMCANLVELDFSMHAFEHLQAMQQRWNLTILPETGLINAISKTEDVDLFGEQIYRGLLQNKTSWLLLNMAGYYWRIVGDAYNAIECIRRALHFSPNESKDVALVNLANVLHRAQRSEEAALVASTAVDAHPPNAVTHFTLGNIYAVLADYNKSVAFYQRSLGLEPEFEMAKKHMHAVLCHSKLEKALEAQHKSLQRTLSDLRQYQQQHEVWLRHQEKLYSEQAPVKARLESRLEYEEHRLRHNLDSLAQVGNDCFHYERRGQRYLRCNVHVDATVHPVVDAATLVDLSMDIELMQTMEAKAEQVEEAVAKQHQPFRHQVENSGIEIKETNLFLPTKQPLYSELISNQKSDLPWMSEHWPTYDECVIEAALPVPSELPSVHLPPENKGFEIGKILPEVHDGYPTRLPVCPLVLPASAGDFSSSFSGEESLRQTLLEYGRTLDGVGHRISFAMDRMVGLQWMWFNMAALYWRATGNALEAIKCAKASINSSPDQWKDIPLVNMAGILVKMGAFRDALVMAREALGVAPYEPETNFVLANIFVAEQNLTGAVNYYKIALAQNQALKGALNMLRRLSCYLKSSTIAEHCPLDTQESSTCSAASNRPFVVEDDPLPDVIAVAKDRLRLPPPTLNECRNFRFINLKMFTSTWLSVSAKGVDVEDHIALRDPIGGAGAASEMSEPFCELNFPASAHTLDHLAGVRNRKHLDYVAENGLKEAFQTLGREGEEPLPVNVVATQVARAMKENSTSWVATTLAGLYWRVTGNAGEAVACLRQALHFAPRNYKDVALVSLANVLHRAGLPNNALVAASMALDTSPNLVVVHFTLANIFAAKGQMEKAESFYESTLALQETFGPARDRLRSIQCAALLSPTQL